MRVMVMVKASKASEAGAMPSAQLLAEMGKYNEELVEAGITFSPAMDSTRAATASASASRIQSGPSSTDRSRRRRSSSPVTGSGRFAPWKRLSSGRAAARVRCRARTPSSGCGRYPRPRISAGSSSPELRAQEERLRGEGDVIKQRPAAALTSLRERHFT